MKKLAALVLGIGLSMSVAGPSYAADVAPNGEEKKSAVIVQKAYDKLIVKQIGQRSSLVVREFSAIKSVTKSVAELKVHQSNYSNEYKIIAKEKKDFIAASKSNLKSVSNKALRSKRLTQRSGNSKTCASAIKATEKSYNTKLSKLFNDASKKITAARTAARKGGSVSSLKAATTAVKTEYDAQSDALLSDALDVLARSCGFVKK